MKKIQMLDLSGQYNKIKAEVDEAIHQVIDSSAFIQGQPVAQFAGELAAYTGAKYAIPCGNGTDALQIALMSLNLHHGDEVIVPAFTYIAAAEVIALLGLEPVPVDVDADTYNLNVSQVQQAITPKTKAIIPVHLFGQSADMEPLLQIAQDHNLAVIEDNAQSIGAEYTFKDGTQKQCGTMGDVGCLSFFPSKNLGCFGDGGAMLTNNPDLAVRLKMIASHGQSVKYRHDIVGCNSRLDTIQAAVLNVKLKRLNQYNTARQSVAATYCKHLSLLADKIQLPVESHYSTHVYHQFTIQVKQGKRDTLKAYLQEQGIPTMIYYPLALTEQPVFAGKQADKIKNAIELSHSVLSLPMHTELDDEQLSYITNQIKAFFL